MDIAVGVVAHTARLAQAEQLADTINADYISVDDGTLGATRNHRKVWTELATHNTQWTVVIEDDAQPVNDFRHQLNMVLAASPSPVVGLYLGHPEHWQSHRTLRRDLDAALTKAHNTDASFLLTHRVLHGVGTAIHTRLISDMLDHTAASHRPFDASTARWASARRMKIAFPLPSLLDHADGPTLIKHPDSNPRKRRKAWRAGTRDTWTSESVKL